jgi:hypothetical protein
LTGLNLFPGKVPNFFAGHRAGLGAVHETFLKRTGFTVERLRHAVSDNNALSSRLASHLWHPQRFLFLRPRYRRQEQENEEQTGLSEKLVNKSDVNPNRCNVPHGLGPSYFFLLKITIVIMGSSDNSSFLLPAPFSTLEGITIQPCAKLFPHAMYFSL